MRTILYFEAGRSSDLVYVKPARRLLAKGQPEAADGQETSNRGRLASRLREALLFLF